MSRKHAVSVGAVFGLLFGLTAAAMAQAPSGSATPGGLYNPADNNPPAQPVPALQEPATSGPIQLQSVAVSPQAAPDESVPATSTRQFEHHDSVVSLPRIFLRQWNPTTEVPPESLISQSYMRTAERTARQMSLKEVIYIALRNNPMIKSIELTPLASMESVRAANGAFDPNLTSQIDVIKNVTPTTSLLQTGGTTGYVTKEYDWDFAVNKLSAVTNGTLGITFDNQRLASNSEFSSINPSYAPTLALTLSQPLLQNFGWQYATLSVRMAESGQKQAQWTYEQSLQDQIQRISGDYWNVVLAEENLEVARAALKFNEDLVRQNAISVRVGTLAPLDLQEAQSAAATAAANVFTAEANLKTARSQLKEDVMFNPEQSFMPAEIEPSQMPNPLTPIEIDEDHSLQLAAEYLPSLASLRESIRDSLLQVKFQENQVLPQLTLGMQIGLTSVAGTAICSSSLGRTITNGTCTPSPSPLDPDPAPDSGTKLPFGGIYGDALNRMWGFSYYNYAAVLAFQMPLDNATAKAALAQARIQYEQQRMNYRSALSQAVVGVENALANLYADQRRAEATEQATFYSRQALHDEEVRFRVGMATTHDLLQFQEEEVAAEGNQVQAFVDLENARINQHHAQGTLLNAFNVEFQLQNPHETPWYARF